MSEAIVAGGGELASLADAEGVIWGDPRDAGALAAAVARAPNASWIQLPFAGIENFVHLVDDEHTWTCGKGVYAGPVAELALTLGLAGMRGLSRFARAAEWSAPHGENLIGARVSVLGGGGITESLVRMLTPFDCHVTVVRRNVGHMDGVDEVLESDRYADALAGADLVVLALALTPETEGLIALGELELMEQHAWLINVARGRHVVTDDLVVALDQRLIGGAGLDVTDPEPLPADHPLWRFDNCLITPHVGNTPEMAVPLLSERITANVRRFAARRELIGLIDPDAGY
ncbi:D-isomer specific 2-hydroxyacid dehydrogenase family protein [soil metagenome]